MPEGLGFSARAAEKPRSKEVKIGKREE